MLGKKFNCKMLLKYFYVRMISDLLHQGSLNSLTCLILCMKYPVLGMATLLCEVVGFILFFVERYSEFYEVLNPLRRFMNNKTYNFLVTKAIAGYQGILYVFLKVIRFAEYCCNPALCITGIRIIEG